MRVARALGWVLVVLLTALIVVRWAGWDNWTPLVQAMVFIPYLGGVCLVALAVTFFSHRRRLAIFLLIVLIAYFAALMPRWAVEPPSKAQGSMLTVMTANLHDGGADPADLVRRVVAVRPDVLAVQELTPGEATALDRAGIGRYLPSRVLRTGAAASGSGIYARGQLSGGREMAPSSTFHMARASLSVGSVVLDIVSVHTRPPMWTDSTPDWFRDLGLLPRPGRTGTQLLLGDFNATQDQHAFRDLEDAGYRDAGITVGAGLKPTWYKPWMVPPVTFDHVLTDKPLRATAVHTYPLRGSDHHILTAQLTTN